MSDQTNEAPAPAVEDQAVEAPAADEFVHPGTVNGYDVLDLTTPYNQAHDAVAGYFRVTCLKDTEYTRDVITDGRSGPNGEMTENTKAQVKAAIKACEDERKGK